jgi:hypothetical protein
MRRTVFTISLSLQITFLLFSCSQVHRSNNNDLQEYKLKGPVKFFRARSFSYHDGRESFSSDRGISFNRQGHQYKIVDYVNGHDSTYVRIIKRDNDEKIIETTDTYDGRPREKEVYKYDSNKKLVEIDFYDSTSAPNGRQVFKYDSENNCKSKIYRKGDKIFYVKTKTYYNKGDELQSSLDSIYGEDGKLATVESKKYDRAGNNTEVSGIDFTDKWGIKWVYQYDKDGMLADDTIYNPLTNKVREWAVDKCDDKGNQTEYASFNIDSTGQHRNPLEVFKYEYDSHGNWTSCTRYDDGIEYSRINREFEYY